VRNATVLRSPLPQGHGGLQKLGYRFAIDQGHDFTVLLSGALVRTPEQVLPLCHEWQRSGADVVLGVHDPAPAGEVSHRPASLKGRLMTRLQNLATGRKLADYHTAVRGYSTEFLRKVPFEANTNEPHFDTELLLQACYVGARIAEVPLPSAAAAAPPGRAAPPRITREALRSTLQFKLHQMGMLCSIKFRDLQPEKYRDKTEMLYSSHAQVLSLVAQRAPRTLIDLGSGTGHVARRCRALGVQVTGVDVRPPQPGTMDAFHRCDLDSEALPVDPFAYDMVLFLDVIEHLSNPEEFLTGLRNRSQSMRLLESAPQMVVSTPNVAFAAVRLNLLLGRFNYAERGILDITHKRLFTRASLLTALRDCGYHIEQVLPVGVPFEAVMGGPAARLLGRLCHQLAQLWPTLFAFQFIVVCRPLPGIGQLLRLAASAPEP
jgi:2-polyprenyl-3-methyl-5-hydroxy-6-metoxy-1,4-benzoquinol methylase